MSCPCTSSPCATPPPTPETTFKLLAYRIPIWFCQFAPLCILVLLRCCFPRTRLVQTHWHHWLLMVCLSCFDLLRHRLLGGRDKRDSSSPNIKNMYVCIGLYRHVSVLLTYAQYTNQYTLQNIRSQTKLTIFSGEWAAFCCCRRHPSDTLPNEYSSGLSLCISWCVLACFGSFQQLTGQEPNASP